MLSRCVCWSGSNSRVPETRTNQLFVFRKIWDCVRTFARMARSVFSNAAGYPRKLIIVDSVYRPINSKGIQVTYKMCRPAQVPLSLRRTLSRGSAGNKESSWM
jgi:hypothetical protein